jgi:hypothetical protein
VSAPTGVALLVIDVQNDIVDLYGRTRQQLIPGASNAVLVVVDKLGDSKETDKRIKRKGDRSPSRCDGITRRASGLGSRRYPNRSVLARDYGDHLTGT